MQTPGRDPFQDMLHERLRHACATLAPRARLRLCACVLFCCLLAQGLLLLLLLRNRCLNIAEVSHEDRALKQKLNPHEPEILTHAAAQCGIRLKVDPYAPKLKPKGWVTNGCVLPLEPFQINTRVRHMLLFLIHVLIL